jgi:hypothetical protein
MFSSSIAIDGYDADVEEIDEELEASYLFIRGRSPVGQCVSMAASE